MNIKHALWRIVALSLSTLALERHLVFLLLLMTMIGLVTGAVYLSLT